MGFVVVSSRRKRLQESNIERGWGRKKRGEGWKKRESKERKESKKRRRDDRGRRGKKTEERRGGEERRDQVSVKKIHSHIRPKTVSFHSVERVTGGTMKTGKRLG